MQRSLKAAPMRSDSTSTVDSETCLEFNAMKRQLFKTKMCRHFLSGKCKYNSDCTFSHDRAELLVRKDMAKTKLCKKTNCSDASCTYAHSLDEIRYATDEMCPNLIRRGECPQAITCPFSHNMTYLEELAVASKEISTAVRRPSSNGQTQSPASSSGLSTPTVASEASANELVQALIQMLAMAQGTTH